MMKRKLAIKGFALLAIAVLLGTIPMGAHAEYHKVEFGKVYTGGSYDAYYFDIPANKKIVISVMALESTDIEYFVIDLYFCHPNQLYGHHVQRWNVGSYYPKITKQYVNLYYNVTSEDVKKYGDGKTVRILIEPDGAEYKIKINVYDKGMGALNVFMMAIIIAGVVLAVVVAIAVVLWRKKK